MMLASNNTGILNTCTWLWLMESEQATPPPGFNKGRSSKFREGSRVRQTSEEGWRTYRLKRYGNNAKDEDNSLKTLNDKNQQASSQKFRRLDLKKFFFYLLCTLPQTFPLCDIVDKHPTP